MPLPLAIYYEHPDWFRPLFTELDKRGVDYVRLDARRHQYDPSRLTSEYALVFNRMSPSAYLRGVGHGLFYTLGWLAHLEATGTRVVNGLDAFTLELSKARQLTLLASLGLPAPRSVVVNHPDEAPGASESLRFPIVVKANVGGSGAGIVRYETREELEKSVAAGTVDMGVDGTALVQEFVPARSGHITRVETLGGKYLYAINVYAPLGSFNLCPADICQTTGGVQLTRGACAVDAAKNGLRVESVTPSQELISAVERIVQTAKIDVGGIELMTDDRDGSVVYYDINALSNFVADAPRVIGFDPFAKLADYLEERAAGGPLPQPLPRFAGEGQEKKRSHPLLRSGGGSAGDEGAKPGRGPS